jgi:hypothetical protein
MEMLILIDRSALLAEHWYCPLAGAAVARRTLVGDIVSKECE